MAENTGKTKRIFDLSKRLGGEDISALAFGKLPPQARDLEEAVLGGLLSDKEAVASVMEILKPEYFYDEANQIIYEVIVRLFERGEPVDMLTVTEALRQAGKLDQVGGPFYVSDLTNRVVSSANVIPHARIIAEKYIQRSLIRISTQIIRDAYDETIDVFDLLDKAEQQLYGVTDELMKRNYEPLSNYLKRSIEQLEALRDKKDEFTGVPSGFVELDRITGGWQPSDLIIVAARPGMGKTAFTLSMARNAAVRTNTPVAIFSLEMSADQLVKRLLSSETSIPGENIRRGNLTQKQWDRLTRSIDQLSKAPIYIDDTPAINVFDLRAKCRRLASQYHVQLFIIDYLQLMSGTQERGRQSASREQEISRISRSLKAISKELNTPVIALSQLNRSVETRGGDKRPQLSDLRESGAIEQDADLVLFIYRPEYYGLSEVPDDPTTEIIIAKHRNGAVGRVTLNFNKQFARFEEQKPERMSEFPEENPTVIHRPSRMNDAPEAESQEEDKF